MPDHRCSGLVYDGWRHVPCSAKGKIFEDKQWWCGVHAPSKVALRKAKSNAAYQVLRDAQQEREQQRKAYLDRARRCIAACEGVPDDQLTPGLVKRLLPTSRSDSPQASNEAPKLPQLPKLEGKAAATPKEQIRKFGGE